MNTYGIYKQGYCTACQNVGTASTDNTAKPHKPKSQTTKMLRLLPNGIIWHTTASVLVYHITVCVSANTVARPIRHLRISNNVMLYHHYREAERQNVRYNRLPFNLKN